jgi:predicted ATPase
VALTGCSGGGKSTLTEALAGHGWCTIPEPGRRLVRAGILPWEQPRRFAEAAIEMSLGDVAALPPEVGTVFMDRSWLDAVIWLEGQGLPVPAIPVRIDRAWLFPPWPELRVVDGERRHSMAEAEAEYVALAAGYPRHCADTRLLPKVSVVERLALLTAGAEPSRAP